MAKTKIEWARLKSLPSQRPLPSGKNYFVENEDGSLSLYSVTSDGEPKFIRGISDEESSRISRLTGSEISKLEGLDTQSELDSKIAGASGSVIPITSTVLPQGPSIPSYITNTGKAELQGGSSGKTYTQTGGSPITVGANNGRYAYYNKTTNLWTAGEEYPLPQVTGSDTLQQELIPKGKAVLRYVDDEVEPFKESLPYTINSETSYVWSVIATNLGWITNTGAVNASVAPDRYTAPMAVNKGQLIEFWSYINPVGNAISFYSGTTTESYITGVKGVGKSIYHKYSFVAPSNGYIRLCSTAESPEVPLAKILDVTGYVPTGKFVYTDIENKEGGYASYDLFKESMSVDVFKDFMKTFTWTSELLEPDGKTTVTSNFYKYSNFIQVTVGTRIRGNLRGGGNNILVAKYSTTSLSSYIETVVISPSGVTDFDFDVIIDENCYLIFQNRFYQYDGSNSFVYIDEETEKKVSSLEESKEEIEKETKNKLESVLFVNRFGNSAVTLRRGVGVTGGALSIIDDDGDSQVTSYLVPMLKSKGLKLGIAIVGNFMERGQVALTGRPTITIEELVDLSKDYHNVEILNHSYTHGWLNSMDSEQQYYEIAKNHVWLSNLGIKTSGFVTPYGAYDHKSFVEMNKFYESNYSIDPGHNSVTNMRNYEIKRYAFGLGADINAIKLAIDNAVINNRWIVLMTHVNGADHYPNWRADFEDLCDYINNSGINVMLPKHAFPYYGNHMETVNGKKMGADGIIRDYTSF